MNIEIHKPELVQRVREQIQSGHFHDVDELLEKALDALQEKETAAIASRRPAGRKSLAQLFAESPLKGLDIDFERDPDSGRDVERAASRALARQSQRPGRRDLQPAADPAALRAAAAQLDALLASTGVTEDDLVGNFKEARRRPKARPGE